MIILNSGGKYVEEIHVFFPLNYNWSSLLRLSNLIQQENTNLVQFGDKLGLSFLQVSEFKVHFITSVPCVHSLTENLKTSTEPKPFTAA